MAEKKRILISGGGTGGHIFPALSIADACVRKLDAEILFVGARGRMEMERVPAAGYEIIGLEVAGFNRKNPLKNFSVLYKLFKSIRRARRIVRDFRPHIAVGVGGYASGPTLKAAQKAGVPTLLQEQNSYPGVTNKLLAGKARAICVAYKNMERFFPPEKIIETGNPIRKALTEKAPSAAEARASFGLEADRPTLLAIGGSLGALSINEAMARAVKTLSEKGIQVIWQTGKGYIDKARETAEGLPGVVVRPFLSDMASAFAAATLVVSRAGAGTISELEILAKACILVPSPNVAEDHQTKNALALSTRGAAEFISDADCREKLLPAVLDLIGNPERLEQMSAKIRELAMPDSDEKIVIEIEKIING